MEKNQSMRTDVENTNTAISKKIKRDPNLDAIYRHLRSSAALFATWLNNRVFVKVLLESAPVIWTTSISTIFYDTFYYANGKLKPWGIVTSLCCMGGAIFTATLTGIKAKHDNIARTKLDAQRRNDEEKVSLWNVITQEEFSIDRAKNEQLEIWINNHPITNDLRLFARSTRNPGVMMRIIADGLVRCIAQTRQIDEREIYVSAAISVGRIKDKNKNRKWNWMYQPSLPGTMSLNRLLNSKSSFSHVANGTPIFYANNKREAEQKGEYVHDEKDETKGNEGSIICFEIDESIKNIKLRLIISISTYGKRIVSSQEEESGVNVKNVYEDIIYGTIIRQFNGAIRECLLWYAISEGRL